jgi:hypothetical protein
MSTYKFDKFPYVDRDIIIPAGTIFYRGIDKLEKVDKIIRDLPLYISSHNVATNYGEVYNIEIPHELKLIDIRKLKNLLRIIITSRKDIKKPDENTRKVIMFLTIAFGLCSYKRQIELLENYVKYIKDHNLLVDDKELNKVITNIENMKHTDLNYTYLNPFEQEGVRIAETYIDGIIMIVLKELFSNIYDGIIAPKMFSPFHTGDHTHEEIIIFDPIKCDIKIYENVNNITSENINTLLGNSYTITHIKNPIFDGKIYMGGENKNMQYKDSFYKDKKYVKYGYKLAKAFRKNISFEYSIKHPNLQIRNIDNNTIATTKPPWLF